MRPGGAARCPSTARGPPDGAPASGRRPMRQSPGGRPPLPHLSRRRSRWSATARSTAVGPARAPVSCVAMSCAAAGGLTRMTSITAQTHATLDGVIDAPPADALLPYMSDAGRQGALDLALAADALLLARETWQGL